MTDYKKYSLGQVENFLYDAMSTDATPQEIYDVIKGVVQDNYYTYKVQTEKAYELLALLNGNGVGHVGFDIGHDHVFDHIFGENSFLKQDRNSNFPKENTVCDKDDPSPECKGAWNDFWEEHHYPEEVKDDCMPPWGHSDMEALRYTEEEMNALCDATTSAKKGKVNKWILPIEADPSGEYFVTFPDDLLEAADLKEGNQIDWIDQGDGSYLFKKVKEPSWVRGNELARVKTYQEMIDDGWTMTDDGFWIKEN